MKDTKLRRVLYFRKAFQMTAISMILVLVVSVVIVITTANPEISDICGPVANLTVEETDTQLLATWEPPTGIECHFLYLVVISTDGVELVNKRQSELRVDTDKKSCAEYIVKVWSLDITGNEASISTKVHFSGIEGTGEVRNLQVDDEVLTWERPQNSDSCNLRYRVDIHTENSDPTQELVEEIFHPLSLIPCSQNQISVTSIVQENDREGSPTTVTTKGSTARGAPVHISTDPQEAGALVTWAVQEEDNHCDVLQIEFTYFLTESPDAEPVRVLFLISDERKYYLDRLEPNARYTYASRWIMEDGNSESSNAVLFRTAPLTSPTFISIKLEGGVFRVEWMQEYSIDFVTKHDLIIVSLGPQHFLPNDCPTDEGRMYNYDVGPTVNFLDFPHARSNFRYFIKVTTSFDGLGMKTRTTVEVVAPMEAPGALQEITAAHQYEPGVQYGVNTRLNWKIPCDVNGPIRHFQVRVAADLDVPEVAGSCTVDFLKEVVQGGEEETFGFNTNVLVSFFKYTAHITTVLESDVALTGEDQSKLPALPTAYNPSI